MSLYKEQMDFTRNVAFFKKLMIGAWIAIGIITANGIAFAVSI